jgi:hypothetical protein
MRRLRKHPASMGGFRSGAVQRKHVPGDMLGTWRVVSYGHRSALFCACPEGHEELLDGSQMRRNLKAGKPLPKCSSCPPPEVANA